MKEKNSSHFRQVLHEKRGGKNPSFYGIFFRTLHREYTSGIGGYRKNIYSKNIGKHCVSIGIRFYNFTAKVREKRKQRERGRRKKPAKKNTRI